MGQFTTKEQSRGLTALAEPFLAATRARLEELSWPIKEGQEAGAIFEVAVQSVVHTAQIQGASGRDIAEGLGHLAALFILSQDDQSDAVDRFFGMVLGYLREAREDVDDAGGMIVVSIDLGQ
jgi:hypothetical protein